MSNSLLRGLGIMLMVLVGQPLLVGAASAQIPIVTSISPNFGPISGGTSVTITGANFTGATLVEVGFQVRSFTVVNDTTIAAVTSSWPVIRDVEVAVTTPAGRGQALGLFRYFVPPPTISSIVPNRGPTAGGTRITISGTRFNALSPAFVLIGSVPATDVVVVDASTITAVSGPHEAGAVDVIVKLGTVHNNVSAAASGIYSYVTATRVTLASSASSALMGQPIELSATVSPPSATGTVTFTDNGASLCEAVAPTGGVARCTTTFATAGARSIQAVFNGSGAFDGASSNVLTQAVSDQRPRTVEAIGRFLGQRNNQILTNGPDGRRQIDRLIEADAPSSGTGLPAGVAAGISSGPVRIANGSRLGTGPDATDLSRLRSGLRDRGRGRSLQDELFGATAVADPSRPDSDAGGGNVTTGPIMASGFFDSAMRLGFATSLSDLRKAASQMDSAKAQSLGLDPALTFGSGNRALGASRFMPFDMWVEARYASFRDNRIAIGNDGHFGLTSIGADYVLSRSLLVGVMVQIDSMRQRSDTQGSSFQGSEVKGRGWMVGPYATLRLSQNVFWQSRAAWGRSDNSVSPLLTYSDRFASQRFLVSSTLAGRWTHDRWQFRPTASIAYMEDAAEAYADAFGVAIPGVTSRLGQAKAGPEVSYKVVLVDGTVIEPRAGLHVIWNFANDTKATGHVINGDAAGPSGARGRVEIGVQAASPGGGIALDLSGSYDGIGADDYDAITGNATLRLRLN